MSDGIQIADIVQFVGFFFFIFYGAIRLIFDGIWIIKLVSIEILKALASALNRLESESSYSTTEAAAPAREELESNGGGDE